MFSDCKQFFLMLALLTFAVFGAGYVISSAAEANSAPIVISYEVDRSRLPPKTKIDMRSLLLVVKDRMPADARVSRTGEMGIEITIAQINPAELDSIKRRIITNGPVSFDRFVIGTDPNARRVIDAASDVPNTKSEVSLKGQPVAKWVPVYSTDFDPTFLMDSNIVVRANKACTELLVWTDPEPLTGDYILSAKKEFGDEGMVGIEFEFDNDGAKKLRRLIADDPGKGGTKSILGLFIDGHAYSGNVVKEQVDSKLFIGSLPEYEIDSILNILEAGALPYPLVEKK